MRIGGRLVCLGLTVTLLAACRRVAGDHVAKVVRRTGRHIDYVWVPKGVTVSTWQVLSGPGLTWRRLLGVRVPMWTGTIPSDHSPVVADLRFG